MHWASLLKDSVLSHYVLALQTTTDNRQMTHYDNSRKLQRNGRLKTSNSGLYVYTVYEKGATLFSTISLGLFGRFVHFLYNWKQERTLHNQT